MRIEFQSEHFTLHPLETGVYAAIAIEGGAGGSNTGLIDLGDRTLVFDAFATPQAGRDLLEACLQLTGRKPAQVVVSHFHADHWGGLQAFAGSPIQSTHATREWMVPEIEEMLVEKRDPSRLEKQLEETNTRLVSESDQAKRHSLQRDIAHLRHNLEALPFLEPSLPDQTFDGKIVYHGSQRSVELVATGKGHTQSDCVLLLPQDSVAFIGDLGFFQTQPFMASCSPADWLSLLDEMNDWEIETFVPGHGPLGGKADLVQEAAYIRALEDMVGGVVQAGGSLEEALRISLPEPFRAWQAVGSRFDVNVRASFERWSIGQAPSLEG